MKLIALMKEAQVAGSHSDDGDDVQARLFQVIGLRLKARQVSGPTINVVDFSLSFNGKSRLSAVATSSEMIIVVTPVAVETLIGVSCVNEMLLIAPDFDARWRNIQTACLVVDCRNMQ